MQGEDADDGECTDNATLVFNRAGKSWKRVKS